MTAEQLALIAGAVLSLLFSYVPKLSDWYAGLSSQYKKLVMGGVLVLTAAGIFALNCAGYGGMFGWDLTCDVPGAIGFVQVLIAALVANQAVYLISRKAKSAF